VITAVPANRTTCNHSIGPSSLTSRAASRESTMVTAITMATIRRVSATAGV
jgi:hypothetical protein